MTLLVSSYNSKQKSVNHVWTLNRSVLFFLSFITILEKKKTQITQLHLFVLFHMTIKQPHDLLFHCRDLIRWYPDNPSMVFYKKNIALYKQDFSVITGRSWSGKSSFIKLLLRQYDIPTKMLFFKNEDMSRLSTDEIQKLRASIWVVYQDNKLIERKTVAENIVYPLQLMWAPTPTILRRLASLLTDLWLEWHNDDVVRYLSGWQRQKVAIARALIAQPICIIADEPTWNLDREESKKIADTLMQLNKRGTTIIFITHDLHLIQYIKKQHTIKEITLSTPHH